MTREEAIECLSERVSIGGTGEQNCMVVFGVNTDTLDEAFDMAISALRQQDHFREATKKVEPLTNAQKIRAMSDEELAWELMLWRCEAVARHHGISSEYPDTQKTILEWLQQPCGEEDKHEADRR